MIKNKKLRFFYWFFRDLIKRYKKSLILGFIVGLFITILIGRLAPVFLSNVTKPVKRIGLVGNISPNTLPLSIQNQISYGLTKLDNQGHPLPGIASSWSYSEDGKEITFHLGDTIWHDGQPVKAQDINYNIEGVTFTPVDSKTLKATLPEPYAPFLTIVSKPVFKVGLVGVGDYKASRVKLKGTNIDHMTLTPAQNTHNLPQKQYQVYTTENQSITAYKRGDIDEIEDITNVESLTDWGTTDIIETPNFNRVIALYFNMNDGLLKEKSFRQGLAHAIPKLSEEQSNSPISKQSWAYNEDVKQYNYDEAEAKELLSNTELPDSFPGLTLTTFSQYVDIAQQIANQWTALGIPTTVKVENSVGSDYQILLSAQDLPPDPDQYPFWHSQQEATNITHYANVRVDKLLEDGRRELNQENRKKIYHDFQKYLMEDIPAIFLYYPKTFGIQRN